MKFTRMISQRGAEQIVCENNFKYSKGILLKNTEERKWTCSTTNCNAKVYTIGCNFEFSRQTGQHNHPGADTSKLNRQKVNNICKRKASQELDTNSSNIIQKEIDNSPELLDTLSRKDVTYIKNSIGRQRLLSLPKLRQTQEDEQISLNDIESITVKDESFLQKPADASVTSKPEVQSVEPIPETSLQQPDGCLPEQTPSSSQTEDTRNCPTKRRNSFGRDYCRMCLEPIAARNQMVPLTLMDINFPTKSASFKQKKEVETYRITGMIQVVMPEFDFDAAYNPIVCHKCVIRLESAYNFITGCRENEAIIQLYKLKYCPDAELVFCEDVAHNKSVLVGRGSPRKKRKTSKEHISTESVSGSLPGQSGSQLEQSGSQLEQSGSQLEQSANTSDNDQTERFEVVYTSSAGQENLAPETSLELRSSIKCETEDYDGCDSDSHFMIPPEEVSCIVKEEVVVKEEVSCDFTDTSNNERVAQMDMNYQVKEEDCSQPDAPSISNMEDYHMHTSQYPATNQTSQIFNRPNT